MKQELYYVCDYCGTSYGFSQDCLDCEYACWVIGVLRPVSGKLAEALDDLNGAERVALAKAVQNLLVEISDPAGSTPASS